MTGREWPTREQWEIEHRQFYLDECDDIVTRKASAYATPEEVEALIVELREQWKQYGRELRAIPVEDRPPKGKWWAGLLDDTPEGNAAYNAARARYEPSLELEDRRRRINRAIKDLRNDWIPLPMYRGGNFCTWLVDRYEAARDQAIEAAAAKRA